ncbi:hypothetical protein L6452_36855 [Arctium lappa]|uniref:Uncharacterized protein n=1 Tax=Arctium lappa TaxID=4217 RepID=A0ACB8Y198_ARCLA|nr:hypothetical protein L6452_36855 [Arctium lappa]
MIFCHFYHVMAYPKNKKMAQMMDLPFDLLHAILIILVMSSDGARDLARVSATCKTLMKVARQSDLLRVVNLKRLSLTYDYKMHHHRDDVLCLCAQAGNLVAETILGKALLTRDIWFWNMIYDNDQSPLIPFNGVLRHEKFVRSFIRYASSEDVAKMRVPLLYYGYTFAGEDRARSSGMICAINRMCSYEILRFRVLSNASYPAENARNNVTFRALKNLLAEMTPPPTLTHRDRVLRIFDRLFPSAPV